MLQELWTPEGEILKNNPQMQPWNVYPRPQMKRDHWLNLNGEWYFANIPNTDRAMGDYSRKIRVPFCPESPLSGIGEHFPEGSRLCYLRGFALPEGFNKGRVILHVGAADQTADVYLNGKPAGHHEGGYAAFSLDVTDLLKEGINSLEIICFDDLNNQSYPYGKQVKPEKRGGMWYTPVSGIWQTVWLESVPEKHIKKLNIENRGYSVTVSVEPPMEGKVTVPELGVFALHDGKVTVTPENPHLWSPENPYLYDFTVEAGEDRVESYFAIRSLEIKKVGGYPRLCLNGKPYFFHGLLDQGYWPDGLFLPGSPEAYTWDVTTMKRLGFNTIRKHIKIEPERFYYDCDRLGMLVFQDLVNSGEYHYLRDTAIPTIGGRHVTYHEAPTERRRDFFRSHGEEILKHLHNHPCIVLYTLFNEGWGQKMVVRH